MSPLELRPLVIVRRHAEGLVSACSAFAPQIIAYADDTDGAVAELVHFLGDYFAELSADQLQKFVVPEEATLQQVTLTLTREDLPRGDQVRTPIELPAIVLAAPAGAKWVLLPSLAQVAYVPEDRVAELEQALRDEVQRLVAASDLDGTGYLDLLPSATFELVRPQVVVDLERSGEGSDKQAAEARWRRDAERLLERVGRKLGAPKDAVLERDSKDLQALLDGEERLSVVLVDPGAEQVTTTRTQKRRDYS